MEMDLEKVDVLRERAGLSYRDAVEYLERAEGDVVRALVFIEEDKRTERCAVFEKGQEVFDRIKDVVQRGNETKIRVDREGKTLAELPVTFGIIGAALVPHLALVGAVTALATGCSIALEGPGLDPDNAEGAGR